MLWKKVSRVGGVEGRALFGGFYAVLLSLLRYLADAEPIASFTGAFEFIALFSLRF